MLPEIDPDVAAAFAQDPAPAPPGVTLVDQARTGAVDPDVAAAFAQDDLPEIDPDVAAAFAQDPVPAPPVVALVDQVRAGAVDPDVATAFARDDLDAQRDTRLKVLFEASQFGIGQKHAHIIRMAEQSGLAPDLVEQHYDTFQAAAAAAQFDPKAFREKHPELARLVDERPALAGVVMGDKPVQQLREDLRAGALQVRPKERGWLARGAEVVGDVFKAAAERTAFAAKVERMPAAGPERATARAALQKEYDSLQPWLSLRPLQSTLMETAPEASAEGLGRVPAILAAEWQYQRKGIERSKLGAAIMRGEALGEDAYDLEKKRVVLEQQMGPARFYNASWFEQLGLDAVQMAASQVESLASQGAAHVAGKLLGGAVGLATKSPVAGTTVGRVASTALGYGAGFAVSYDLESGSAYLDFRNIQGPDGKPLDRFSAVGAAAVYGLLAAALEVGANEKLLHAFGPAAKLAAGVEKKEIAEALLRDSTFRQMVAAAGRDWLRGVKGEASEEAVQQGLQGAIGYFLKVKAGNREAPDLGGGLGDLVEAGTKAAIGAGAMGPGTMTVHVASQQVLRSRMLTAEQQVAAIAAASKASELATASPEALAQVVAGATSEQGAPVTSLFVDPGPIVRLFQDGQVPLEQGAKELLGEGGAERIQQALATGSLLEVPVAEWAEKVAKKPMAEQLIAGGHVTTRFDAGTPAQLAGQEREVQAKAKALVDRYKREDVPADSPAEQRFLVAVQDQLLKVKDKLSPDQAREQVAALRAGLRTLAGRAGVAPEIIFGNYVVRVQQADEAVGPAAAALMQDDPSQDPSTTALGAAFVGLEDELQHREHWIDPNTGLYNREALERLPVDPALPFLAEVDLEGKKPANDFHKHGAFDALLRAGAQALHGTGLTPWSVVERGSLYFPARDLVHAQEIVRAAQERMPDKSFQLFVAGAQRAGSLEQTLEAIGGLEAQAEKTKARAQGAYAERGDAPVAFLPRDEAGKPIPSPKNDRGLPLVSPGVAAALGKALAPLRKTPKLGPGAFALHPELVKHTAELGRADTAAGAYVDKGTGLYSLAGWVALRHARHRDQVIAFDLAFLRELNDTFGSRSADRFKQHFGIALARTFGDIAFLHGDEYAGQHDDAGVLQDLAEEARKGLHDTTFFLLKGVDELVVQEGVYFGYGIAGDYDSADGLVEANKAKEKLNANHPRVVRGQEAVAAELARLRAAGNAIDLSFEVQPANIPGDRRVSLQAAVRGAREARAAQGERGLGEGRAGEVAAHPGVAFVERPQVRGDQASHLEDRRPGETSPRGWVDIANAGGKRLASIFLTKKADFSTFLHESGHVFLDVMGELADRADTPGSFKADWATLLGWFGVERKDQIGREHHERFARGLETYFMEGKAPSLALKDAFAWFSRWLKRIYGRLPPSSDLNDEVRAVFDRMLATDREIAAARERAGLKPLYTSPEAAGMSPRQWAKYLEDQEFATSHAARAARLRELREQLAEKESALEAKRTQIEAAAAAEYDQHPASRGLELLQRGKLVAPDGEVLADSGGKLSRGEVQDVIGEDATRALEARLGEDAWRKPWEQGPGLDELAGLFGFDDGTAFAKAVSEHLPREAWIADRVGLELEQQHGDLTAEHDRLAVEVDKGLHGDATAAWLLTELRQLRRQGQRVVTEPAGVPVVGRRANADIAAIQRAAHALAQNEWASSLQVGRAEAAERAAARNAAEAAARGDFAQAYVFKQQQLLNFYLARERMAAREMREKFLKLAAQLSTEAGRAQLGRAAPQYRDAVDTILEALGLAPARQRERQPFGLEAAIAKLQEDGKSVLFDPDPISGYLAQPRAWGLLKVGEVENVLDALTQFKVAAADALEVLVEGRKRDKDEVVVELLQEARENLPKRPAPATVQAKGPMEANLSTFHGLIGELLQMETIIRDLGGGDRYLDSMWFKALMQPLQKAKHRESDLLNEAAKPVVDAFEKMPASMRTRASRDFDGKKYFPEHREDLQPPKKWFEVLMMALNVGNDENRARLLEGRHITEEQLHQVLAAMTREEWAWVQTVWDACESLWPLSRDLEERSSGLAPPKVRATPVETPFGTLRGGYFPAVYDRQAASQAGERQAVNNLAALQDHTFSRPGTSRGHLKKRAEDFADAVALDPSILMAHLAQVCHDVAFREAIQSVGRLVLDERVQAVIKEREGPERSGLFLRWAQDVGKMRGADVATFGTAVFGNRVLGKLRANFQKGVMAFRADIAAGDLTNVLLPLVDGDVKARYLAAGLSEFARSPFEQRKWALEKFGELRTRKEGFARELRQKIDRMVGRNPLAGRLGAWYDEHAFAFMEATDAATSTPVVLGAYKQGLDEAAAKGLEGDAAEARAVTFAESVLRRTFPSYSPVDASAAMRDKGALGTSLVFFGYFNVLTQRYHDFFHDLYLDWHKAETTTGKAKAAAKRAPAFVAHVLALSLVTSVLAELLSGRGPSKEDGDDERERWRNWFLRKLLLGPLLGLPFGGIAESVFGEREISPRAAPSLNALYVTGEGARRLLSGDGDRSKAALKVTQGAALALGKPGLAPIRAGTYLLSSDGARDADGALEVINGLVYGPGGKSPPVTPLRPRSAR